MPPVRSGVSDYAVELLKALSQRAKVRVVTPPGWSAEGEWPLASAVELVPPETEALPDEVSLVHIGNNPHHLWLVDRLGGSRTVVVLHDLVLHHLLVEAAKAGVHAGKLEEALRDAHGEAGSALARARAVGLTGRRDPFLFPAWSVFIDRAAAVVVHSRWAEETLLAGAPDAKVCRAPLPAADPGVVDREAARRRIGVESQDIVLMHLGFLTPEKGLQTILAGVAAAVRAGVRARLLLVGEGSDAPEIQAAADAVGLADRVTTTGWLAPEDFPTVPAAADLGIVLRTPSAGETSAAVLRFLACGTPVAVGGRRQFLEWPETAAPRITPGPAAPAELARTLLSAATGGSDWLDRRRAARTFYERGHTPDAAADRLVEIVRSIG